MTGGGAEPGDRPGGACAGPPPLGLATAAAAAASSCVFVLGGPFFIFWAFVVAWLHAVLLGLPLYLVLSRTRPLTEGAAVGGGCAVGALPVLLLSIAMALLESGFAGIDWLGAFVAAFLTGFLGALGGAAFHMVMRRHAEPRGFGPSDPPL